MQSGGASSSSDSVGWSLTKEAVEHHVDEVLRDSATVRRLVKALNEVGHLFCSLDAALDNLPFCMGKQQGICSHTMFCVCCAAGMPGTA